MLRSFLKFGATGLLATGVHFVVAIALIEFLSADSAIANGIAFITSTSISFFINTLWSFQKRISGRTLVRYISVSTFGLLFTMGIAKITEILGYHYLFGIFAVLLLSPPLMFLLHRHWTFRYQD